MATEKQVAANRRNALKSTGPRSLAGKIKSRANALRHGLASKTLFDPSKRQKIDALTQIFARQTDAVAARAIAEAQVELHYVERYRAQLLAEIPPPDEAGLRERGEEITKILCNVPRLLRYERNAASNRNRAILKK
jgi:hypothetical protein